jgi:hypothetical protein
LVLFELRFATRLLVLLGLTGGGCTMIVRPGLLVAIVICVVLVGWWAASGFPMVSLACKQAHRLTLFRGPFSSLCYHSLLSDPRSGSRERV